MLAATPLPRTGFSLLPCDDDVARKYRCHIMGSLRHYFARRASSHHAIPSFPPPPFSSPRPSPPCFWSFPAALLKATSLVAPLRLDTRSPPRHCRAPAFRCCPA